MQWRRNDQRNRGLKVSYFKIILSCITILVFGLGFLLIKSNIFTTKSVDVKSEEINCVSDDPIKNTADLIGQNIVFVSSSNIEKKLKDKYVCIKYVSVVKHYPDKIKLNILGREPTAILVALEEAEASFSGELNSFSQISVESSQSANFNFVVDNEGVIFSNNIENINAPVVYVNNLNLQLGQKINGVLIENILKILNKVKIFGVAVKNAKMYSEQLFLINAEPRIIFKMDKDIDIQIASLQLILNKAKIDNESLEFIDLRFDKPIVRIAPKKK